MMKLECEIVDLDVVECLSGHLVDTRQLFRTSLAFREKNVPVHTTSVCEFHFSMPIITIFPACVLASDLCDWHVYERLEQVILGK